MGSEHVLSKHLEANWQQSFPPSCLLFFEAHLNSLSTCGELAARRGRVSLGGFGKTFNERTCSLLPFLMPRPDLWGRTETFSTATYLPFLFVATTLAEEMKGMQVNVLFFETFLELHHLLSSLGSLFVCVLKFTHDTVSKHKTAYSSVENPLNCLDSLSQQNCLIALWLLECLLSSARDSAYNWLELFPPPLQGQRTGTDKD